MADEIEIDLDESQDEHINKTELRIKSLSDKVRTTAEERDGLLQEKEKLAKEVDFFKNFSKVTSKYSDAAEYQDQIMEKVMSGYDVEDAAVSILHKEGKFAGTTAPSTTPTVESPVVDTSINRDIPRESPAGGSAANGMRVGGEKPLNEMTRDEIRAALIRAEAETGDITRMFTPR